MNTSENIISQINKLTTHIKTNYPELYQFIEEQPITIPSSDHPKTDEKTMYEYLDSLKQLLQHHIDTHTVN